jgi:hypothetical protein
MTATILSLVLQGITLATLIYLLASGRLAVFDPVSPGPVAPTKPAAKKSTKAKAKKKA